MSAESLPNSSGTPDLSQVQNLKRKPAKVQTVDHGVIRTQAVMTPYQQASVLFDLACVRFGEKNLALALTISAATGQTVSESMVSRWRNVGQRDLPNEAQLLALGSAFNRLYYREKRDHFGWARLALIDLITAVGDVALNQGD